MFLPADVADDTEQTDNMKMSPRHSDEMISRLERAATVGTSFVFTSEIMLWYGREKLTKNIWRDIDDKWRRELGQTFPLFVAEWEGQLTFLYAEGMTTNGDWTKDVRARAGRPLVDSDEEVEEEEEEG